MVNQNEEDIKVDTEDANEIHPVRITGSGREVDFEYQEAFIECLPRHQTRIEV